MRTEITKYNNVQTGLCQERRKSLGTEENPEDRSQLYFRKKFYVWHITPASFEKIALKTKKKFSTSLGLDCVYVL